MKCMISIRLSFDVKYSTLLEYTLNAFTLIYICVYVYNVETNDNSLNYSYPLGFLILEERHGTYKGLETTVVEIPQVGLEGKMKVSILGRGVTA